VPAKWLFDAVGLSRSDLNDLERRIPAAQQCAVCEAVSRGTRDRASSIHMAEDAREAVERHARYGRIVDDDAMTWHVQTQSRTGGGADERDCDHARTATDDQSNDGG